MFGGRLNRLCVTEINYTGCRGKDEVKHNKSQDALSMTFIIGVGILCCMHFKFSLKNVITRIEANPYGQQTPPR
jgi:hypothetical protein